MENLRKRLCITKPDKYHLSTLLISTLTLASCGAGTPLVPTESASNTSSQSNSTQTSTNQASSGSTDESESLINSGNESENSGPQTAQATSTNPEANSPSSTDTSNTLVEQNESVACNASSSHIQQRTLSLINEARSQPRTCGTDAFAATHALTWNTLLLEAANNHSLDMTQHNFFDHTGSDGSTISMRVDATGYNWRTVGENIAAGQDTASQAVEGWLNSPGHCRNLMSPDFTDVAIACIQNDGADYTRYWTNVLAAPF